MRLLAACLLALCAAPAHAQWRVAEPGWKYEYPRDHGSHAGFKTEWWYFTGNLRAADGREFGYQLTFFRQGIERKGGDMIPLSHSKSCHSMLTPSRSKLPKSGHHAPCTPAQTGAS